MVLAETLHATPHIHDFEEDNFFQESIQTPALQQGSDEWLRLRFSAWAEALGMERVRAELGKSGRNGEFYQVVERWLGAEVYYFLTEFGAGRLLPIQPPYQAEIERVDDEVKVFAFNMRDYGDQKRSYVSFDGIDRAVRDGLKTAYESLSEMSPGQGLFRLSPSEFYTSFGSTYDVVEFYRVTEVREDGSRLIEGRYLILDRILTQSERLFLVNQDEHVGDGQFLTSTNGDQILAYSPESVVRNPQITEFGFGEDPILEKINTMSERYERVFGKPLVSDTDFFMYEKILERVSQNLPELITLCLNARADDRRIIQLLRSMMFSSQRQWATLKGIDPDKHIESILSGEMIIGFEAMDELDDPVAKRWFDRKKESGYCLKHQRSFIRKCVECESDATFLM